MSIQLTCFEELNLGEVGLLMLFLDGVVLVLVAFQLVLLNGCLMTRSYFLGLDVLRDIQFPSFQWHSQGPALQIFSGHTSHMPPLQLVGTSQCVVEEICSTR